MSRKRSASEIAAAMLGGGGHKPAAKKPRTVAKPAGKPAAKALATTGKPTVAQETRTATARGSSAAEKPSREPTVARPTVAKATRTATARGSKRGAAEAQQTTTDVGAALEAARTAVAAADFGTALRWLLAAWQSVPAPELASAIDRVGERARHGLTVPPGKTAAIRNAAWDRAAREGDPVMRGVLLESLTATRGNAETLARIELLVPHRDPRTAARLVDLVETPIYNASVGRTNRFWKRLFALLPELGDPRILERQRAFASKWEANTELNPPERPVLASRLAAVLPAIIEAYRDPPVLSRDDAARAEAVVAAIAPIGGDARTEAELLAAVYANPDDDHARMVYADHLQQQGDPRGELVALQLARATAEPSAEQARRERELLAEHLVPWLGGLAQVINKTGVRFERGFLDACQPKTNTYGPDPMWSTVREIDGAVPESDDVPTAALRVLSNLRVFHLEQLARLTRPLPVETMSCDGPRLLASPSATDLDARLRTAYSTCRVLPALRHVEITREWMVPVALDAFAYFWDSPTGRHLETLVVPADVRELTAAIATLEPTQLRRVVLRGELRRSCPTVELERDAAGRLSRLVLHAPRTCQVPPLERAIAGIEGLPATALTTARVAWGRVELEELRARALAAFDRQLRLAGPVTAT